jgi:TetR/AcrR family transcriptional repressor of nem operon
MMIVILTGRMTCVILNVKGTRACRSTGLPRARGQVREYGQEVERMGSSKADKAVSHERIVKAAAARIRRDGTAGVSVADLMREAGLTHGGFYRHFDSRDDLVAEAVEAALAHGSRRAEAAARLGGPEALATAIDAYLSALHRDKPETGCAVAALPTDIARSSQRARTAYTAQVRRYLDVFAGLTSADDPDDPHLILAALVGAIALARAVDDPGLSDEILERVGRALHRHLQAGHGQAGSVQAGSVQAGSA